MPFSSSSALPLPQDIISNFSNSFVLLCGFYWTLAKISSLVVESYYPLVLPSFTKKQRVIYTSGKDLSKAVTPQITSIIHALISANGAMYVLYLSPPSDISRDHLFGENSLASLLMINSAALFLTELLNLLSIGATSTVYDRVIILHHAFALTGALLLGSTKIGLWYCMQTLLGEISTFFLGIRWLGIQMNLTKSMAFKLIEFLFIFSFVSIRVIAFHLIITRTMYVEFKDFLISGKLQHDTFFPLYPTSKIYRDDQSVWFLVMALVTLEGTYFIVNSFFLEKIIIMALRKDHPSSNNSSSSQQAASTDHAAE